MFRDCEKRKSPKQNISINVISGCLVNKYLPTTEEVFKRKNAIQCLLPKNSL